MRAPAAIPLALLIGCSVSIREGQLECATDIDCPPAWSCSAGHCFSSPRDAGEPRDGGQAAPDATIDARVDGDGGGRLDSGTDAARPDASLDLDGGMDGGPYPFEPSCYALHLHSPSLPDGLYRVDPDGPVGVDPFDVYCDMTTAGGGWTLVDNDATDADVIRARLLGANTDLGVTRGAYLPAFAWSPLPQLLCRSSLHVGTVPWVTFNAISPNALEYPTQTTTTVAPRSGEWSVAILNDNPDYGAESWIVLGSSRIGTVLLGRDGVGFTCGCDYNYEAGGSYSGVGTYAGSNTSTCSTWVR